MTIRVQMPEGTDAVSVAGQSYKTDEDGIVTVENPEHVAPLVSAGGLELDEEGNVGGTSSMLLGSSIFPATFDLGEGRAPIQLGSVVTDTYARLGISEAQWNNLPQRVRDVLIGYGVALATGTLGTELGVDLNAELERDNARLRAHVTELEAALQSAGAAPADTGSDDASQDAGGPAQPTGPDFTKMTMGAIAQWQQENNGPALTGNKDDFIAQAVAHQQTLIAAQNQG